jgi:hypothetical protein
LSLLYFRRRFHSRSPLYSVPLGCRLKKSYSRSPPLDQGDVTASSPIPPRNQNMRRFSLHSSRSSTAQEHRTPGSKDYGSYFKPKELGSDAESDAGSIASSVSIHKSILDSIRGSWVGSTIRTIFTSLCDTDRESTLPDYNDEGMEMPRVIKTSLGKRLLKEGKAQRKRRLAQEAADYASE